jgi:hypothetical protein
MLSITAVPAYGRDYKSKQALMNDFNNGVDFYGSTFNKSIGYFNKKQVSALIADGYTCITFRYRRKELSHIVQLKDVLL